MHIYDDSSVLLRMRNAADKICRECYNTHFNFKKIPPPPDNRAVYEIIWKNVVQAYRRQMTIRFGACVLHAE